MNAEQKAAYVFAQAVSAMAAIEAMKAENIEREANGFALAFDESAFRAVETEYCISHNAVLDFFRD
ncbi:MAG: hypothetical protein ACYS0H_29990 [Planctomycetota bacterium]|jgi:hypothetical protein